MRRANLLPFLLVLDDLGGFGDDGRLAFALGAQRAVARSHMTDLMRHHRRDLGAVASERQKAARHVKVAGRQCEGVDDRRIEDRHLVCGLIGVVAGARQFDQNAVEISFGRGSLILAAKLGDEFLMLDRITVVHARRCLWRTRNSRLRLEKLSLLLQLGAAAEGEDAETASRRQGAPVALSGSARRRESRFRQGRRSPSAVHNSFQSSLARECVAHGALGE